MPDTGTPWYIPYPVAGDAPDDPTQSRIRAEQIHADLNTVDNKPQAMPLVQVRQSVAQGILHGTLVPLLFDVEDFDPGGMHSTTVNTSRLTCALAGWYEVWGCVSWAANTAGRRIVYVYVNGAATMCAIVPPTSTGAMQMLAPVVVVPLNVGDYVELIAQHDAGSGVTINTIVGAVYNRSYLGARWLRSL